MINKSWHYVLSCTFLVTAMLSGHSSAQQYGANAVSALGFIEPEGGILQVSGAVSADGSVVDELRVTEGQVVEKGEIIALLNNHQRLEASKLRAEAQIAVRRARLDQMQAGASQGAINAQKARVERLRLELISATTECQRFETLGAKGTVSDATIDEQCLVQKVIEQQLAEAIAVQMDLNEVREVDVAVLRAELSDAEVALTQSTADYERALVRSPVDGTVLRIYSREGEVVRPQGIVEIGKTSQMWVRAEIYETDISRVAQGQTARITADGFPEVLEGSVEDIGLMVGRNRILSADPTADVDARVVEVRIRLTETDSKLVSRLTNLQVNVIVETGN